MKPVSLGALALAMLLTASVAQLSSQGPPDGRGGPPPFGGRGGRGGRGGPGAEPDLRETADALSLSPAQVEQLRVALDTRDRAEQGAQRDIQVATDALADAEGRPSPNTRAVDSAAATLQHAQEELPPIDAKFRADFMAILTDQQKQTLDAIRAAATSAAALSRLGVLDNPAGRGAGPGPGRGRGGPPQAGRGGPPGGPGRGGPRVPGGRGNPANLDGPIPAPPDNPITPEKVALGQKLFFDKTLSGDGTVACASCHNPDHAFTDGRAVAVGIGGQAATRNAPTLINAAFGFSYFWDGRARTIEQQVLQPIYNPKEMGSTEGQLERASGVKVGDAVAALASYVRTIRSSKSPYDAFEAGQVTALSPLERAGLDLFRGKGGCAACHVGPNFSDGQFHNTGVGLKNGTPADEGRFAVTRDPRDHGAFKTPTLREVARTAPYMHDGSLATLEDVVNFYSDGGRSNPYLDPRIRPLRLSSGEKAALVAFLKALSGTVTAGAN